ncbi:MAG: hypothetical protein NT157_06815 [Candidatus Micrarchaeota archaeon]|nr:hypothetical protein [Candidatus Micrarchaeota archaeon]
MKRILLFLLCLAPMAFPVVIVPPVIYFLTLSLSAFLSNALVSLVVFGALKGVTMHKYLGKSAYELAKIILSASGTAMIAIACMLASVIMVYPLDLQSAAISALLAGVLFLAVKFISIFADYRLSEKAKQRSMAASLILTAIFIALATGASAFMAVDMQKIGVQHYEQYEEASQEPWSSMTQDYLAKEAAPVSIPEEASKLWFTPKSGGKCVITVGSFTESYEASFSCSVEEGGAMKRVFCPIPVPHEQVPDRGRVNFRASGACEDAGVVLISDSAFEQLE